MPRIVDHAERRQQIADALLRVVARDGLGGVSLRQVAREAGVTSGMVQHYFASKDEMMSFAMHAASARYEERIGSAVQSLGPDANAAATLRAVLSNFIPRSDAERHDGRISLEFQSYAAGREELSRSLAAGDAQLAAWLTQLVADAADIPADQAAGRALGVLAAAEGLGVKVIGSGLSPEDALAALEVQLDINGIA